MPEDHQHKDTPKDALLSALAECEAVDAFSEVIIIYNTKSGRSGSYDSGLTTSEAGWLCQLYITWLAACSLGVVVGKVKRDLFSHVGFRDPDEKETDGQDESEAD